MSTLKLESVVSPNNSRGDLTLMQKMARLTGRTPAGCSQETYSDRGAFARARDWAFKLRRAGAKDLAFRKAQDIVAAATVDENAPPVTDACLAAVEKSDADENVKRWGWAVTRDEKHLDELIQALDREILEKMELRARLVAGRV